MDNLSGWLYSTLLIAVGAFLIGANIGAKSECKKAIEAGVAYYVTDTDGNPKLVYGKK